MIQTDGQGIAETLEHLVKASLVTSLGHRPVKRYQLLSATRLYAAQKLSTIVEKSAQAQRRSRWVLDEQSVR
jgi:hypothetical protein